MNKKNILIISGFIIFVMIISGLITLKYFIYDPIQREKKIENQIKLIRKYFDNEEYSAAKNLIEPLVIENSDSEEIIKLYNEIIKAEKEKRKFEEMERYKKYDSMQRDLFLSLKDAIWKSRYQPNLEEEKDSKILTSSHPEADKLINEGITAYLNRNYTLAKSLLKNALKYDSKNAYANAYLAAVLYEENPENVKRLEEASIMCNVAIEKNDRLEVAHFTLARIYIFKNLYEEAIEELSKTIKINPFNYLANYELGKIYFIFKDYDNSRKYLLNSISIKTDFIDGYYYLGELEFSLKNYKLSIDYFNKILQLDPQFYLSYISLAKIYKENNNYDYAIKNYEKSNKIEPNFRIYFEIAECNKILNIYTDAIKNYNESIKLNPEINEKEKKLKYESYLSLLDIHKILKNKNEIKLINKILDEKYSNFNKEDSL